MNIQLLEEISQLEAVTFEIEEVDALDQTLPAAGSTSCCSCTSTSSCSSTSSAD